MKRVVVLAVALIFVASVAFAGVNTYQVTGPVLELTKEKIVVQKGKEKWEIAIGSAKIPPDVKVGSKVTIKYEMKAVSVEPSGTKSKKK